MAGAVFLDQLVLAVNDRIHAAPKRLLGAADRTGNLLETRPADDEEVHVALRRLSHAGCGPKDEGQPDVGARRL